ncbi:hypothetical protein [Microbulbifer elongatus]|uniref:hypothetical protein n=1 Tax=Microbulbifer elongatus TaxID=86173 RepID=UPI001E56FC54|nr:hypothetical protein [Microbulbifer elongatus]
MSNLISQHQVLDYCAFEDSSISCFNLSGIQLIFSGEISTPAPYGPEYIAHKCDIYDHSVYEPFVFVNTARPYKGNRPAFSYLPISEVYWRHFVPYGEQLAAIGSCSVTIKAIWPAPDRYSAKVDLKQRSWLERVCFDIHTIDDLSGTSFIYPERIEDLIHYRFGGRDWVCVNHGNYKLDREYCFYTALTPDHLLMLDFHPDGYFAPGTAPPQEDLEKIFVSFWDFLDKLSIIEDGTQSDRAPGIELKGEALERQRLRESSQPPESEDGEPSLW